MIGIDGKRESQNQCSWYILMMMMMMMMIFEICFPCIMNLSYKIYLLKIMNTFLYYKLKDMFFSIN